MTTRTMNVQPDAISAQGSAWGTELPVIIIEQYEDGEISRRVRIQMRPIDIEEMARRLWEIRAKYAKALEDMTRALKDPVQS